MLIASVVVLSAGVAFGKPVSPTVATVPDGGSSALLLGAALMGLTGFRTFLKKKG